MGEVNENGNGYSFAKDLIGQFIDIGKKQTENIEELSEQVEKCKNCQHKFKNKLIFILISSLITLITGIMVAAHWYVFPK